MDLTAPAIERGLTAIESAKPTFATKADVHSPRARIQAMWSVSKADLGEMKAAFGALRGHLNAR